MDTIIHEQVSFDIVLWRKILEQVSIEVSNKFSINIEVISPFGFEILMDPRFLKTNLRRFYAYLGSSSQINVDSHEIISFFRERLSLYLIKHYKNFYEDIVIFIEAEEMFFLKDKNYICKKSDKLIDIQFRRSKKSIIADYADYIITSLDGLILDKGESRGYQHDIRHRWRYYQLYIMQENLYKDRLPDMSEKQIYYYTNIFKIVGNMIQIFYNQALKKVEITTFEQELFEYLILPRIATIRDAIKSNKSEENITISSVAYHFNDLLSIEIARELYDEKSRVIMQTYYDFPLLA